MLTLNSLKIQIRISEHYAITSSTSHINSKHQSVSFLILIQNFLRFSILGMKHSKFNLQYLNVGEAHEKTFSTTKKDVGGDAAPTAISNHLSHSQPQIQTAYISPVSTH